MWSAKPHPDFATLRHVSHNCEDIMLFKPNLSPNGVKRMLAKCTSLTSPLMRHTLAHTNTHTHTHTPPYPHVITLAKSPINKKGIHGVVINTITIKGQVRHYTVSDRSINTVLWLNMTQLWEIISRHNWQVISHGNEKKNWKYFLGVITYSNE